MNKKLKNLLIIAMFSAVAFVLQFFEFPLPMLIPPFIKMDFSDLPELLATFMLGSPAGICVCLIKNLLHLIDSSSGGVGELSNFLLGTVLCVVSDICYRRKRTKRGALIAHRLSCHGSCESAAQLLYRLSRLLRDICARKCGACSVSGDYPGCKEHPGRSSHFQCAVHGGKGTYMQRYNLCTV